MIDVTESYHLYRCAFHHSYVSSHMQESQDIAHQRYIGEDAVNTSFHLHETPGFLYVPHG
jgi:hypothetical protein